MQKKDEIEFFETAMKNLKGAGVKKKKRDLIDGVDWVLNVVLKHYYGIRHECTKGELQRKLSIKPIKKGEREALLELTNDFHTLKYETKHPSKQGIKKIFSRFTVFFENKIAELTAQDSAEKSEKAFKILKIFSRKKVSNDEKNKKSP